MSAICRNEGLGAVNDGTLKLTAPSITARPTPEEKRLFAAVAAKRQISESTLALIAIRALLDSDVPRLAGKHIEQQSRRRPDHDPSAAGRSICAIRQRAAERRMKDSAYIAALVRGHVAANPPLATHELAAFKTAVSVFAWFGRVLARTAREAAQAGVLPRDLQQDLSRSRALVADVERRMHEFARAALVSWESRVD